MCSTIVRFSMSDIFEDPVLKLYFPGAGKQFAPSFVSYLVIEA
jgi:hypothetical protein